MATYDDLQECVETIQIRASWLNANIDLNRLDRAYQDIQRIRDMAEELDKLLAYEMYANSLESTKSD